MGHSRKNQYTSKGRSPRRVRQFPLTVLDTHKLAFDFLKEVCLKSKNQCVFDFLVKYFLTTILYQEPHYLLKLAEKANKRIEERDAYCLVYWHCKLSEKEDINHDFFKTPSTSIRRVNRLSVSVLDDNDLILKSIKSKYHLSNQSLFDLMMIHFLQTVLFEEIAFFDHAINQALKPLWAQ